MEADLLSVRTNTAAMKAATAVTMAQRSIETSMERLSTGKRVNSAADDAAGVAISSRLNASLRGTNQSITNALDAQALLDTAEGAMQETEALLQRIRELAVQAASDTNSSEDRAALDAEKTQLLAEIDRIASTTSWAGQNLLDGNFTSKSFQVGGGTMAVDQIVTSIAGMSAANLDLNNINLSSTNIALTTPRKSGSEFQVNTYTTGNQGVYHEGDPGHADPYITSLPNGGYVIAWTSVGQDGSGNGVFAQIYDSNDAKVGAEFQVNTHTNNGQLDPAISAFSDNKFIVVWTSNGQDGSMSGVYGQIFNSDGTKSGSEFLIPTNLGNAQYNQNVKVLSDGNALVTWESYHLHSSSGGGHEIFGQLISSSGSKIGSEFQINTVTAGGQNESQISELSNGNVIVAYESGAPVGERNIRGQIIDASGTKVGSELTFSTSSTDQVEVAVAGLTGGGFVTTWQAANQDGDGQGVYYRVFDNNGTALTGELLANTTISGDQTFPKVATLADGGFLLAWSSDGQDGDDYGIFARKFSSSGDVVSDEFQVNTTATGLQKHVDLIQKANGDVVATWISNGQDGDSNGIFAQILEVQSTNMSTLDTALQTLNSRRASLGALSNRLDHIISNNTNIATNLAKSISRIEDADFAAETTNLAKQQILQQASIAMLAQANASKQNILTLLQG